MIPNSDLLHIDCGVAMLRPWRPDDLASVRLHARPAGAGGLPEPEFPYPYAGGDGRAWLERVAGAPGRAWAVDAGGQAIGGVSLEPGPGRADGDHELGYWLGRAFHGRGLMSAILATFVPAVLATPGVARITAIVYPGNPASCRVLEKTGFRQRGSRRTALVDGAGRPVVAGFYAIGGCAA